MRTPNAKLLTVSKVLSCEEIKAHKQMLPDDENLQSMCEGMMMWELSEAIVQSDFMVFNRAEHEDGSITLKSSVVVMDVLEYKEFLKWWDMMVNAGETAT